MASYIKIPQRPFIDISSTSLRTLCRWFDVFFAFAVTSTATPKEIQYSLPSAQRNEGTCTTQGFMLTVGIWIASFYNCMICLYYLSIITFNKKDDYIKHKLEPWFHGVPIILTIVIGIAGLIMKQYNTDGTAGVCHPTSYNPPHCEGGVR